MAFQRARRPSFRSGRSLGSPLKAYLLGVSIEVGYELLDH